MVPEVLAHALLERAGLATPLQGHYIATLLAMLRQFLR
eukprot:COSAG01_NODE_285_length_19434_cov_131.491777_21_plen_38_part_00